jgi:flagellar basal-body rod protein FlgB
MFGNSDFGRTQFLLERGMDATTLRWQVINNNIANAGVPGFKRSDVTFESQMRRAIDSQGNTAPFEAKLTNTKHIPFHTPISVEGVKPKIILDYQTTMRNDGNGVDVEYEMVQAAKTQMRYSMMSTVMARNYRLIAGLFR